MLTSNSLQVFFQTIISVTIIIFIRIFCLWKKLFRQRLFISIAALHSTLIISCKKDIGFNNSWLKNNKIINSFSNPIIHFDSSMLILHQCISSYEELVDELEANPINVIGVELYDGTKIYTGNHIINMTFTAYNISESYSLFRSEFNVSYNLYGYQQENSINCWSLGCLYVNAGVPPYTCILKGSKVLLINTSFVWNLPNGTGQLIKYIIIP